MPRGQIQAILRIKYDPDVLDRTNLILVHTTASNAGMFIGSDVYELPFVSRHDVDKRLLMGKSDLLKILEIGLAFNKAKP